MIRWRHVPLLHCNHHQCLESLYWLQQRHHFFEDEWRRLSTHLAMNDNAEWHVLWEKLNDEASNNLQSTNLQKCTWHFQVLLRGSKSSTFSEMQVTRNSWNSLPRLFRKEFKWKKFFVCAVRHETDMTMAFCRWALYFSNRLKVSHCKVARCINETSLLLLLELTTP